WNRRGAHTGGRNSTSRSICFAGNFEANKPTEAALATAAAIYAEGKGRWWTRSAPLRGHREVKSTACPGKNVWARMGTIRTGGSSSSGGDNTSGGKGDDKPVKVPDVGVDGVWGKATTKQRQALLRNAGWYDGPLDGVVSY